ncbi:TauD/TfdA family dioxygenase [Bordetella sp. BOR01]|uniref:TauD/TfdA dioxygenase family protein n=1 Tax=Bordetella sp. BOR01 TaxID=2854779 RepID=UPI001C46BECB|nr:TauD/TfdA family dioxygenase [Bordetella sp. BOR01]MBV7482032.1 TauD/TfdA family dioxygenase [Bordetella sp. BOR01]
MTQDTYEVNARDPEFPLFDVYPVNAAFGATLHIDDVTQLDERQTAELRRAWLKYHVVRIRGQHLDDAAQVAFGRRFGELKITSPLPNPLTRADLGKARPGITQAPRDERYPQITIVSNVVDKDLALGGLGSGELSWHSDMCQFVKPPSATIVYGAEIPIGQGGTSFASMALAARHLAPEELASLSTLSVKQDEVMDSAGYPRAGYAAVTDVTASPGRAQPLVTRHPETGAPVLFLGRRLYAHVPGLPVDESERLLDRLWAHATQARFVWTHDWKPGDIVIWDNRSVLHKREPFDPEARRMLRRVVVEGAELVRFALEETAGA